MDSIKEDIHQELQRLRLDKRHLYSTLLRIIDTIPQAEAPVEPVAIVEAPSVTEAVAPPPTPVKKTSGRKKKVTVEA